MPRTLTDGELDTLRELAAYGPDPDGPAPTDDDVERWLAEVYAAIPLPQPPTDEDLDRMAADYPW